MWFFVGATTDTLPLQAGCRTPFWRILPVVWGALLRHVCRCCRPGHHKNSARKTRALTEKRKVCFGWPARKATATSSCVCTTFWPKQMMQLLCATAQHRAKPPTSTPCTSASLHIMTFTTKVFLPQCRRAALKKKSQTLRVASSVCIGRKI